MNMTFENFYVNRTQVETKKFATFKEFEIERQAVRKEYIDTCPDTCAKLEVCVIYVNCQIGVCHICKCNIYTYIYIQIYMC